MFMPVITIHKYVGECLIAHSRVAVLDTQFVSVECGYCCRAGVGVSGDVEDGVAALRVRLLHRSWIQRQARRLPLHGQSVLRHTHNPLDLCLLTKTKFLLYNKTSAG